MAANSLARRPARPSYPAGYSTRLAADATDLHLRRPRRPDQQTTPAPAGQSGYETTTYAYDGNGNLLTTHRPARHQRRAEPGHRRHLQRRRAARVADDRVRHRQRRRPSATATTRTATRRRWCTPTVTPPAPRRARPHSPWVVGHARLSQPRRPTRPPTATTRPANWSPPPPRRPPPRRRGATTTSTYDPAGNMLTRPTPTASPPPGPTRRSARPPPSATPAVLRALGQLHLRRRRQPDRHDRRHRVLQLHLRPVRRTHLRHQRRRADDQLRLQRRRPGHVHHLPAARLRDLGHHRHRHLRLRQRRPAHLSHRLQRQPDHHHQHRRRPAQPAEPSAPPATPSPPPTTTPTRRRRSR